MELVDILQELWRRRWALLVGLFVAALLALRTAYDVRSYLPPVLDKKSYSIGVASTQMLIDAPASPIADLVVPFDPLVARARVYSKLVSSEPVRESIGRKVGIPGAAVVTQGPSEILAKAESPSEQGRSLELAGEASTYRLSTSALEDQPIISIMAQAPTAEAAEALANAAVTSLKAYVEDRQSSEAVAKVRQPQIVQLGQARGSTLNQSADRSAFVLAFVGTFIAWCVAVLALTRLWIAVRTARSSTGSDAENAGGFVDGQALLADETLPKASDDDLDEPRRERRVLTGIGRRER